MLTTRDQLREIARKHRVGYGGLITIAPRTDPTPMSYTLSKRDFELELDRWPLHEVDHARRYLNEGPCRRVRSPKRSSYFLKHEVERWLRLIGPNGPHCYTSNGSMLIACLLEGIKVGPRCGPNAKVAVDIASRQLKRLEEMTTGHIDLVSVFG